MMTRPAKLIGLICLFSVLSSAARADSAHVAVASNFAPALSEIAQAFEQQQHHHLKISPGSSGKLYAQIIHGAPFDVFFSADQRKPIALQERGIGNQRQTYATGRLVLWSLRDDLTLEHARALTAQPWQRLALANPRLAPYGLAATQVLEHLGLHAKTRARWVQGENIAQTYQFVATGNADLGFIALAQWRQQAPHSRGHAWIIPSSWHDPIHQDALLITDNAAARSLLEFMRSASAQAIMQRYGYALESPPE